MQLEFAFLCDAATVDSSGKLNVLGIFDALGGEDFPVRFPRITVVVSCLGLPEERRDHSLNIRLLSPDGQDVLEPLALPVELPTGTARARMIGELLQVQFEEPGPYSFEVELDGRPLGSIPLKVTQRGDME